MGKTTLLGLNHTTKLNLQRCKLQKYPLTYAPIVLILWPMKTQQPVHLKPQPEHRLLRCIAQDIRRTWPKPFYGAVPYLDAMASLEDIEDVYGLEDAESIILYFLSNATTWRGEDARRIKKELKTMCGIK